MNLRAKVYVENQKKKIQEELTARLARLKEEGGKDRDIQRDATVRRLKALVRKMDSRMGAIAAQEKLSQERAQAKIDKLNAEKAAKDAPKAEAAKAEPEKKEKKAKKEKGEKPPKAEGKAEAKGEGKPEGKKEKKEKPPKPEKAEKKPGKEEGQ